MAGENGGRPGILAMARSLLAAPFEERMVREAQARYERASIEAATSFMSEASRLVQPEDDGFVPIGGDASGRKLGGGVRESLQAQALRARYRSPLLRGYLKTLSRFVMGRGPTIRVDLGGDPDNQKEMAANDWLERFRKVNEWSVMEDEIPDRIWRDGEIFLRTFVQDKDGPLAFLLTPQQRQRLAALRVDAAMIEAGITAPKGMLIFRTVPPENVADPAGIFEDGIVTAANDARHVLGYIIQKGDSAKGKNAEAEFVPAAKMLHRKIEVDSDVLRGRSLLEILLEPDKKFSEWLNYRMALNLARSAVYLFKRVEGTGSQGAALRAAQEPTTGDGTNDRRQRMLRPMTTVAHGPGIEYEFKAPNLQAQDAQHDGRMLQLTMAAGVGLPEYLFTGDASNANYASTLVAEGPAFREFESQREVPEELFLTLHRRALIEGALAGSIPGWSVDDARTAPLIAEWPNIEVRDEIKHTQANQIRHANHILSREGWALDDGVDWETERERVEAERSEDMEWGASLFGGNVDGGTADDGGDDGDDGVDDGGEE